jgi:putative oxidoreductase
LLAILRIVVGLLFLEHGLSKFLDFPVPFPVSPLPPLLMAAGAIELVTGALIAIGLFTRIAAFIASGEMAVGYWMQHFPKSPWPVANMGEGAILFCFIFLYLAAAGAGAWSVDEARLRNAPIR